VKVPLLDPWAQNRPIAAELTEAFQRVLESGMYIMGKEVEAFEAEVAAATQIPHALAISSGTDALLLALMALEIGPGDEVIVPSFTFFATAGCVRRLGARPVFADVCPVCFNLEPRDLESKITPKTKAIIPVHLFGQMAAMDEIMAIAEKHDLKVIEDAAQSQGATYRGRQAGSIGDAGIFSFFPSKNLGGLGDSGMLVTRDAALYEKAKILRVHGMAPKYHHSLVGGNFRADPLQCAFLRIKLQRYPEYCERRSENAEFYLKELSLLGGVEIAEFIHCECTNREIPPPPARLVLPLAYPHNQAIWNQFTLRVPSRGTAVRRNALRQHLLDDGIGCEVYYPVPLHAQECFADQNPNTCPVAARLADEVLSIPIHPELLPAQRLAVVKSIQRFLANEN
jgi:dTDP-4-amino-4,6-dideoxygalactose transaminase